MSAHNGHGMGRPAGTVVLALIDRPEPVTPTWVLESDIELER